MSAIASFVFNPFQENTYVVSDPSGQCVIIDPGCYTPNEQEELSKFLTDNKLTGPLGC